MRMIGRRRFAMNRNDTYNLFLRVFRFYRDGFRAMDVGRTLWIVIIVKLVVIFVVLRLLFFVPATGDMDESERAAAVMNRMTESCR